MNQVKKIKLFRFNSVQFITPEAECNTINVDHMRDYEFTSTLDIFAQQFIKIWKPKCKS